MQTQDPEKCYEALGLRPGASPQEIKAAYRDLAKVWHPDRFAHDPQLQHKAQERLKEINQAYKQLSTSGAPRHATADAPRASAPHPPTAPRASRARHAPSAPIATRHSRPASGAPRRLPTVLLAAAVAGVVLLLSFPVLRSQSVETPQAQPTAASQPAEDADYESAQAAGARKKKNPAARTKGADDVDYRAPEAPAPARAAIPTVNLTIDPTTNLIATGACPKRVLMTYVKGEEPHQFCNAAHRTAEAARRSGDADAPRASAPPPTDAAAAQPETPGKSQSKLKSVLSRVVSPGKWFRRKKDSSSEPKTP